MNSRRLAISATMIVGMAALLIGASRSENRDTPTVAAAQKPGQETQPQKQSPKKAAKKDTKRKDAKQDRRKKPSSGKKTSKKKAQKRAPQNPPNAEFVGELIEEAEKGGAEVLSVGDSHDDFVSVAQTSDGSAYAAYAGYYNGHDQIRLHKRGEDGRWSTHSYVPLAEGRADIWMPQLAVDAKDRLWVIWAEQTGQTPESTGNWDLFARPRIADRWGELVRLTTDGKPDINPHVAVDSKKNIHVVWQAHPDNNGDIRYCRFDGESWSKPLAVTSDAESDWYPHVAVDKRGTVWIAFDSYRNGDYDVFLTSIESGRLGKVIPIAASNYYEAHASVACTPDGRVWVAWEQGGHNWGKDQGYWLRRENRNQGTTLGSTRTVKAACWKDGQLWAAPDVEDCLPKQKGGQRTTTAMAELAAGDDDRLWLRFRHMVRRRRGRAGRFRRGWTENVTHLTADGWAKAQELPASTGRISVFSRILPAADGSLWIAYSGDARAAQNLHRPIHDTALIANLKKPQSDPATPKLSEYAAPDPPAAISRWNTRQEERQVAAIRNHRVTIDGKEHRIVRGDLHRHTELSWDVGPGNDGSYLDFYRYMIDVAEMDFGGLTDHQGGGHYAYWWWLTEKSCDMYYLPPRFVPLYGYERSVRFPDGHRNVFHAYRGVPVFPFQLTLDQSGPFPGVGTGAVVDNDTKLLYEFLHRTGGIAISHTSGSDRMGTDWRDNDPVVEPVVEIYQGARNSYEALGAPRVHPEDEKPSAAPGGFQKEGLMWNAWEKGYRLGITSSSDHGSTHISYSLVYTPENDRRAIIEAIKKRQTYGATDNLIVSATCNGRFMGSEFDTREKPELKLSVQGTAGVKQVKLVRSGEYILTREPGKSEFELTFVDMKPQAGLNYYYFRIEQSDGEVAWCSPVWVNYRQ